MINKILQVILSGLLLLTCEVLYAQDYVPFPDSNAIWKVTYVYSMPPPPWGYNFYYHYVITGDTTVNEMTYQKIYKIDLDVYCTSIILDKGYAGAIRDVESEERVYFLPPGYNNDTLLYDFSLSVGDTLPPAFNNPNYFFPQPYKPYIMSIDSILVNEHYHQRFILGGEVTGGISLIEGVGSTTGLLEELNWFEGGGTLWCFELNDTLNNLNGGDTLYCKIPTDTCYSVGFSPDETLQSLVTLYPNPCTNGYLNLTFSANIIPEVVYIQNIYGETMIVKRTEKDFNIIDVRTLPKGLYILVAQSNNGNNTTKFIIN